MTSISRTALVAGVLILAASSLPAAVLYYDGFEDYNPNTGIVDYNGGLYRHSSGNMVEGWGTNGWAVSSTTNGTALVTQSNGNFTSGNALTVTPTAGTVYATRKLVSTISTGTIYLSLLIDNAADNGRRFMAMTLQDSGNGEMLYVGQRSGTDRSWGIYNGNALTGTHSSSISDTLNPTLLVLRIDFNSNGANERLRLYVNPDLSLGEPGGANVNVLSTANMALDSVRFGAGFADANNPTSIGRFDEFYITDSWASIGSLAAVPEPGRALLLALAGMAFIFRRRGKREI